MAGLRVPFEGEPLSGIQVMGILETRLLDFKHVILLSMNEEVMPASSIRQSFIPYALRLAFGMPAREDMDAMYAYYFSRLLQRSEKVDLLYNATTEGIRTGEMSRYLHQIICQWDKGVTRPGLQVLARATPPINIRHTDATGSMLARYLTGAEEGKILSPSAINTYLDCSLKFYLRYLAGIGEPEEVKEEIDPAGFGTVVHDTIRLLYKEIAGKHKGIVEKQDLEQLIRSGRTTEVLTDLFRKHHLRGRKNPEVEGRNIIVLNVMNKYLQKLIGTDMAIAPFTLVSAEQTCHREIEILKGDRVLRIRLGGKIDRVDRVGDTLRVIDYKPGEASQSFPGISALFDPEVENRNGAVFQTLFYAWLVSKEYPDEQVMPGLYILKSLYGDRFEPGLIMGSPPDRRKIESFVPLEKEFRARLEKIVTRIFDPTEPFVQTRFESRCRLCDYSRICSRGVID
jgi:CRISPR/Cas system-associated exonuclease Cas4 (RecB family)